MAKFEGEDMSFAPILFILLLSPAVLAKDEVEKAKASLKGLLEPILQKPSRVVDNRPDRFSVDKCEKHKINWRDVLMLRQSLSLTYKFKTGCDIEGTINPSLIGPFPADLKLKNLDQFTRLQSSNKITSTLEMKPVMNLTVREAVLSGKNGKVLFEADYAVRMNPLEKDDPVEENLGGEIRIKGIYGTKVSITEKIMID